MVTFIIQCGFSFFDISYSCLYYNKMFHKIWYENIFVKILCEFKVLLEINKHGDQCIFKGRSFSIRPSVHHG